MRIRTATISKKRGAGILLCILVFLSLQMGTFAFAGELRNGNFSEGLKFWTVEQGNAQTVDGELVIENTGESTNTSLAQELSYDKPTKEPIFISCRSKAENVAKNDGNTGKFGGYSLYADIGYEDGTWLWGQRALFSAGTHDWETVKVQVYPAKPVKLIRLYLLLRGSAGKAWFDDICIDRKEHTFIQKATADLDRMNLHHDLRVFAKLSKKAGWKATVLTAGGGSLSATEGNGEIIRLVLALDRARPASQLKLELFNADGSEADSRSIPIVEKNYANPLREEVKAYAVNSLEKVYPDQFPADAFANKRISMVLARNEAESAQVAFSTAPDRPLPRVSLRLSKLLDKQGRESKDLSLLLFVTGYVWVDEEIAHASANRQPGWNPDILLSNRTFDVPPNQTQTAWLDVRSTPMTAPGIYTGELKVFSEETEIESLPISVTVKDILLPKRFSLDTAFALMDAELVKSYGQSSLPLRRRQGMDLLLDARINPSDITRATPPEIEDILYCVERGMTTFTISQIVKEPTKNSWAWRPEPGDITPVFLESWGMKLEPFMKKLQENSLSAYGHFYGFDECEKEYYPAIKLTAEFLKRKFPETKFLSTERRYEQWDKEKKIDGIEGTEDWFCPLLAAYSKSLSAQLREKGKKVWWYVCSGPNYPYAGLAEMGSPLLEQRLLPWMTFQSEADGLLYWHVNLWAGQKLNPDELFQRSYILPITSPNRRYGDAVLMYPSIDGPVPSIRLFALRDGLEDYAALKLLNEINPEIVRDLVGRLIKSSTEYSRSTEEIKATRDALYEALDRARETAVPMKIKLRGM